MDNNIMRQAMAKAGIEVPEKVGKLKDKEQTIEIKYNTVKKDISALKRYIDKYTGAPDEFEKTLMADAISSRINNICQFIKDMGVKLAHNYGNTVSKEGESLNFGVREIKSQIKLTRTETEAIEKLLLRNEMTHDYVNADINKFEIADFFTYEPYINSLNNIVDRIKSNL